MRISATKLESFRYYLTTDKKTQAQFIEECKVKSEPSKKMRMGTAFHDILENPLLLAKCDEFVEVDGFKFKVEDCKKGINLIDYDFPFEVKTTKEFEVAGDIITIVTKVDQLVGMRVKEHKTRWSEFKIEKYMDSLQPKLYNNVFEVQATDFIVFEMKDLKSGIKLQDIHQFSVPHSANDTQIALDYLYEFVGFIHLHKLESYFQPKQS